MENNGGCDQRCINSPGSFNCLCNVGFDLYTENGTAGFNIASSETGMKDDDVYRINKTCVRKFSYLNNYFSKILNKLTKYIIKKI